MKKMYSKLCMLVCLSIGLSACGQTAKKVENSSSKNESTELNNSNLKMETVNLNDPNLEEQWKKEPYYGKKIKVGFEGALCTSGLGVAQVKGFFAKYGLDAEIINTPNMLDAIGTGKLDATTNHIAASMVPAFNGVDMVFARAAQTGCRSLYVLNNSDIKSTKDLVGKEVAISGGGIGGHDHNIALRFLFRDGVDYKSVKFKPIESAATIQAMKNGEVHAAILSDQFAKKFVDSGELRSIRSITFDDDFKEEPCCTLILNKTFVEQNPITAAKLVEAHKEASNWIEDNKYDAAKLMKANNWGSGDIESDYKFLQTYNFKVTDEQMEKTLNQVINDYKEFGIITKDVSTQDILNKIYKPRKVK